MLELAAVNVRLSGVPPLACAGSADSVADVAFTATTVVPAVMAAGLDVSATVMPSTTPLLAVMVMVGLLVVNVPWVVRVVVGASSFRPSNTSIPVPLEFALTPWAPVSSSCWIPLLEPSAASSTAASLNGLLG